jgi:hypothetical protein
MASIVERPLAWRVDYVKERLRLLYVGITGVRRELIITWNTGRQGGAQPGALRVDGVVRGNEVVDQILFILRSTINSSLKILFFLMWGIGSSPGNEITKTPNQSQTCKAFPEEDLMIMNKTIFDENWKMIRTQAAGWWSLMAEYDLNKVDKADVKFDKFVTMLQVKYGYTREKAREEITRHWSEYEEKTKSNILTDETGSS